MSNVEGSGQKRVKAEADVGGDKQRDAQHTREGGSQKISKRGIKKKFGVQEVYTLGRRIGKALEEQTKDLSKRN